MSSKPTSNRDAAPQGGEARDPDDVPSRDDVGDGPAEAHAAVIGRKRGVIGVISRGEHFLVIRRSRHVTAPRKLCLPGGTIEAGETESEALVREMQEELSIDVRPVRCCYRSRTPWGTLLAWWVAELSPDVTPIPDPTEVESYCWMTLDEIQAVRGALPSLPEFFAAVRDGQIEVTV